MKKKLLWIASSIVGLLVLATLVVRFLIPADTWKRLALEQFEARTGMQATAESARLEFPWPVGLRMSTVTLDDDRPDAAYQSLHVAVDHVVVTAQLMSLIQRKPRVNEIRLVRPRVDVTLREEPRPEEPSPSATDASAPGAPAPVAAVLSLVRVEDGEVIVRSEESTIVLAGLDQSASFSTTAQGTYEGRLEGSAESCRLSGASLPTEVVLPPLRVALNVSGELSPPSGRAELDRFELGTVQATGPVTWSQAGETWDITATLDVAGDLLPFEPQMWSFVTLPPELQGQVQVQAASMRGQLSFEGSMPPAENDPAAVLKGLRGAGEVPELKVAVFGLTPFSGRASWSLADGTMRLDPLHVEHAALSADGDVVAVLGEEVRGTATARGDLAALRELARQMWPHLPASQAEGATSPDAWPIVTGPVQARAEFSMKPGEAIEPLDLPVRLEITGQNLTLRPVGWSEDLRIASARGTGDLRRLAFEEVAFSGPGLKGRGDGSATGWPETIQCAARVRLEMLDLDALQAATAPVETSWWPGVGVTVAHADEASPMPSPPANLSLDLDATATTVQTRGYQLTDVTASGRLAEQRFDIQKAEGKLGTGRVSATGHVDWKPDTPVWDVKTRAEAVPAGSLLEPFAAVLAGALNTNLSGTLDLSGPLSTQPAIVLQALTGEGMVQSTTGRLKTEPVWGQRIQEFLGREGGLFKEIDFRELTAGITVAEGRVELERAFLRGNTELAVSGWVGLSGNCDYRLRVTLPAGATPSLGALEPVVDLLRDEQKRISFGVAVSGPSTKPEVRIDTKELQDRAALAARQRGEKELGNLLSNPLGSTATDSTQTDVKQQVQDKAKEALGGLLGGKKKKGGGGR